jgi:hypothetical protein
MDKDEMTPQEIEDFLIRFGYKKPGITKEQNKFINQLNLGRKPFEEVYFSEKARRYRELYDPDLTPRGFPCIKCNNKLGKYWGEKKECLCFWCYNNIEQD